jgi:magnesium-transporting ATPase (P-type)
VPADCRLIEGLRVNRATVTGESVRAVRRGAVAEEQAI